MNSNFETDIVVVLCAAKLYLANFHESRFDNDDHERISQLLFDIEVRLMDILEQWKISNNAYKNQILKILALRIQISTRCMMLGAC